MELQRKDKLLKLKRKNQGNVNLSKAIDKLINDIEQSKWKNKLDINILRPDADRVHNDNIFFFDINIHRTMVLIIFNVQEAEILWVGNHAEYDSIFKGNKKIIETWLRNHGKIK